MDKEIIRRWENNKEHLRSHIKNLRYGDCNTYEKMVRILISECLNYGDDLSGDTFNADEIVRIDHGHYQGTEIYLFHMDTYQPGVDEYYIFNNYYGSCSGCDALKGIFDGWDAYKDPVTDEQADELMTLLLHMVQRIRCLDCIWKEDNL